MNKKNLFEIITAGLTVRHPNRNIRYKLDLSNLMDFLDEFPLKKNKSFISLYMLGYEIFLGEVNVDLSSLPAKEIQHFASYISCAILDQLMDFTYSGNYHESFIKTLREHTSANEDGISECRLRYIVNPDTEGECMAFEYHLDLDRITFIPRNMSISGASYDPAWLDYWNDRTSYFTKD